MPSDKGQRQEGHTRDECEIEKIKILQAEWKTVIETQMHFNDMLMRMRTAAISVVVAIFGAAAALMGQFPDQRLSICGRKVHASVGVIFGGLVLWIVIFIMDYCYYYKMLLGAVERGQEFDRAFEKAEFYGQFHLFGMTTLISTAVRRPTARRLVCLFYGVIFALGALFLAIVLISYRPM